MTDKSKNELLSKLCSQLEQKYVTEPSKPPDLNEIESERECIALINIFVKDLNELLCDKDIKLFINIIQDYLSSSQYRSQILEILIQFYEKQDCLYSDKCFLNNLILLLLSQHANVTSDLNLILLLFVKITEDGFHTNDLDKSCLSKCLSYFFDNINELVPNIAVFLKFIDNSFKSNPHIFCKEHKDKILNYIYETCTSQETIDNDRINIFFRIIEQLIHDVVRFEVIEKLILSLMNFNQNETQIKATNILHQLFTNEFADCALYALFYNVFDLEKGNQFKKIEITYGSINYIRSLADLLRSLILNPKTGDPIDRFYHIIKQLFTNTLINLPHLLDFYNDKHILKLVNELSIDFVHLVNSREFFSLLLTSNSVEFLMDVIEKLSIKIDKNDNENMSKFVDLLNLIDRREILSVKQQLTQVIHLKQPVKTKEFDEQTLLLRDNSPFNIIKNRFYGLVDSISEHLLKYINESCITNCIEFLNKKYLPWLDDKWLENMINLLMKYFKQYQSSINIRKFCIDIVFRKINELDKYEFKTLKEIMIFKVIDSLLNDIHLEQEVDFKAYLMEKLVDLSKNSKSEENYLKIINIFDIYLRQPSNDLLIQSKIINNGLIDLFEICLNLNQIEPCARIFNILVSYLMNYYSKLNEIQREFNRLQTSSETLSFKSPPSLATSNIITNQNETNRKSDPCLSSPDKRIITNESIRFDIFDFLLRLRSNEKRKLYLNDKKRTKKIYSNYLMLKINSNNEKFELNFKNILDLVEICFKKETDLSVLKKVMHDVSYLFEQEIHIFLEIPTLGQQIFDTLFQLKTDDKLIETSEDQLKFDTIIATLALNKNLEKQQQEYILGYFYNGVRNKTSYRYSLETLTVCIFEMHQRNLAECSKILLKLSQISQPNMAQSVLELLSNISELPKLLESDSFTDKEFIAVSAIAIRYTDPSKYTSFVILLAHYVICLWFLKCPIEIRKKYASFTIKGLQELLATFDRIKLTPKDSKSPLKQDDVSDSIKKDSQQQRITLTDSMKTFYKELVDVTIDFMSNYFYSYPQAEFHDFYSRRKDYAKDPSRLNGNSCVWLVGNRIIRITTNLFSGICGEDSVYRNGTNSDNHSTCSSNSSTSTTKQESISKLDQDQFDSIINDIESIIEKEKPVNMNNIKRRFNSGNVESNSNNYVKYMLESKSKDDLSIQSYSKTNQDQINNRELNEICKPNCWCNNLVEITIDSPTKVVSYITLIDNLSHEIDLTNLMHDSETLLKLRKKEAIDVRASSILPRISESSDSYQGSFDDSLKRKTLNNYSNISTSSTKTKLQRKSSFDSATLSNQTSSISIAPSNERNKLQSINPRQVFLHLFNSNDNQNKENAILLPDNVDTGLLPMLSCFMIHKIGVIYVGHEQSKDEKAILSNASGSLRYKHFLNNLGTLVRLKNLDTFKFNSGGLETDGSAGDFTLIWFDGITQFVFHVITMMPSGENVNLKKKHIGNDNTLIVYNESGDEYNLGVIRSEVNCICIEIEPLKDNVNLVRVKTSNEMSTQFNGHTDSKLISDNMLPIFVRKLAFHAELASNVYRKQKDGNQHGGRWIDRLKQINRIKNNYFNEKSKTIKQQQQQQQNSSQQLQSSSFANLQTTLSSFNEPSTNESNFDFTNVI